MVLFQHGPIDVFRYFDYHKEVWHLIKFIGDGSLGVTIFFVLSGFIISIRLLDEKNQNGKINFVLFYQRRASRIIPLYLLVLLIGFWVVPPLLKFVKLDYEPNTSFLANLFFVGNFDLIQSLGASTAQYDELMRNILWTVSIEVQFYIIAPFIFQFSKNYIVILILGLGLFSLGYRHFNEHDPLIINFHSLSRLIDFCSGMGFALIFFYHSDSFKRLNQRSQVLLIMVIIMLIYLLSPHSFLLDNVTLSLVKLHLVKGGLIGLLILVLVLSRAQKRSSILDWGGNTSYGIYLLHPLSFLLTYMVFQIINIEYDNTFNGELGFFTICIVLTFVLSHLSYRYIERPFLKLKKYP